MGAPRYLGQPGSQAVCGQLTAIPLHTSHILWSPPYPVLLEGGGRTCGPVEVSVLSHIFYRRYIKPGAQRQPGGVHGQPNEVFV
jgi:hypothetical protein